MKDEVMSKSCFPVRALSLDDGKGVEGRDRTRCCGKGVKRGKLRGKDLS